MPNVPHRSDRNWLKHFVAPLITALGAIGAAWIGLLAAPQSVVFALLPGVETTVRALDEKQQERIAKLESDVARLDSDLEIRTRERDTLRAEIDKLRGSRTTETPRPPIPPPPIRWNTTAEPQGGQLGQQFSFACPSGGSVGRAWGTTYYTVGSSICTAAVHAGKITPKDGGVVTIFIEDPHTSFYGSTANGVTSLSNSRRRPTFSLK
jgi:hypothetical protein